MAPPSSGGATVGEALNILERFPLGRLARADATYDYLEASRLAFADRGAWLGDSSFFSVPWRGLLTDSFAAERAPLIGPRAPAGAVPAGNPTDNAPPAPADTSASATRVGSTTNMTVTDRWGNVVTYTFTIEQTGGSGMVVPGRGFLLNNELTDFNFGTGTANSPEPGKRPRSSISPTIVLHHGRPAVALGSPGGATIITTVLQILVNRIDLGQSLPHALAAPRASNRNAGPPKGAPA